MTWFWIGLGMALILEGLMWGVAPKSMREMVRTLSEMPDSQIRAAAIFIVSAGVIILVLCMRAVSGGSESF